MVEVVELAPSRVGVELQAFVEREEGAMTEQHEAVDSRRQGDEVVADARLQRHVGSGQDVVVVAQRGNRERRAHAEGTPPQKARRVRRIEERQFLRERHGRRHGEQRQREEPTSSREHGADSTDAAPDRRPRGG